MPINTRKSVDGDSISDTNMSCQRTQQRDQDQPDLTVSMSPRSPQSPLEENKQHGQIFPLTW